MEDLNSVISAEQLSDEVLAMISEQIEQRESLDNQEVIYDYVSNKFKIPKSIVISQDLVDLRIGPRYENFTDWT